MPPNRNTGRYDYLISAVIVIVAALLLWYAGSRIW